ncbi:MAG: lipoate--protein ligase family protein [Opitutaceae bacterium]
MDLEILPTRSAGAAENMAVDFLLLQRYPRPSMPRFRHYDWRGPAFTFGYSQKIAFIREQVAAQFDGHCDLCRRPTGGGLVDHRDDWTFSLVIPRGHPLEELRATQSYREVHEVLAAALREQGVPAITKAVREAEAAEPGPAGVCFQRAEVHDVIHERSGEKIAGAAQKRNKQGLLFQGSIAKAAVGVALDWDQLGVNFSQKIADALGGETQPMPWPEFNEDELSGLIEQYSSPEWMEGR